MLWLAVDAALVVLALAVLAVLALSVRQQALALHRDLAHAREMLAAVTTRLQVAFEALEKGSPPAVPRYDADNWPRRGRGGR